MMMAVAAAALVLVVVMKVETGHLFIAVISAQISKLLHVIA